MKTVGCRNFRTLLAISFLFLGTSAFADLSLLSNGQQEVAIYTITAGTTVPGGWEEYPVPLDPALFDSMGNDVTLTTTTINPKPSFGPNNPGKGSEITINTPGVYRIAVESGGNGSCLAAAGGAQITLVVNGTYLGSSDGNMCAVTTYEYINSFRKGDTMFFTMRSGSGGTFQASDQAFTRVTVQRLN